MKSAGLVVASFAAGAACMFGAVMFSNHTYQRQHEVVDFAAASSRYLQTDSHAGHNHGASGNSGFQDIWQDAWSDDTTSDENHDGHDHGSEEKSRTGPKPWGAAIGAAFAVNLCTLVGVLAFFPAIIFGRSFDLNSHTRTILLHVILPSFACGALVATAVFLLLPEAVHLLEGGHGSHEGEDGHAGHNHRRMEGEEGEEAPPSESEVAWKYGTSILGGYFLPFVVSAFFPNHADDFELPADENDDAEKDKKKEDEAKVLADEEEKPAEEEEAGDEEEAAPEEAAPSTNNTQAAPKNDYQLASSILAGDFFHNFADGIFIGTAFLLCDRTIAWTIVFSTIFHELSQELADFFLLINQCGFSVFMALLLNFVSGLSVLLGVVAIFATDVHTTTIGSLLAVSAGVYFYVAMTEIMPRVQKHIRTVQLKGLSFLMWTLGAIPIGLVLLNHEHC